MNELSNIDRSYKRPRLHYESSDVDLNHKRARHDLRLKSRFEKIFQKYEKDFSETADEIDLETGEIVVNNGHLAAMVDEFDLGQDPKSTSCQQPDVWNTADDLGSQGTDWINNEEEDIRALSAFNGTTQAMSSSVDLRSETAADSSKPFKNYSSDRLTPRHDEQAPRARTTDRRGHQKLQLSSSTNGYNVQSNIADNNTEGLCQATRPDRPALESAWQAPPLPEDRSRSFVHPELPSTSSDESQGRRSPSPPRGSLWAPMAGRGRPRRDGPAPQRRRPPSRREPLVQLERSAFDLDSKQHEDNMSYVPTRLRRQRWLQEENELLIRLRTTTQLSFKELEPYFTGRSWNSIAFHWSQALRCDERHPHLNDDNNVESTMSTESEEEITLHDHSPSDKMRNCESSSVPSRLRPKRWLQEENELLRRLKTTTQLSYREMEPYFTGRSWRSIATHWSREMRCGERLPHLDGGNNVEPMAFMESEEEITLHDHTLSDKMRNCESSSRARGILGHSTLLSKLPIKTHSRTLLSSKFIPFSSEQRLNATLDFDDELGDHPLEEKLSAIHLTKSSPVPACSRTNSVVSATKTGKPQEAATPGITHSQTKKHQPLNKTPSHTTSPVPTCPHTKPVLSTTETMKPRETATPRTTNAQAEKHQTLNKTPSHTTPLENNGELSDSCELGLSPPHERTSAPSYRTRTGFSTATPLPFQEYKRPGLLGKATTTPKPLVTEDSSEDELATPVKTIGTPQGSTKKLCSSSR